MCRHLAWLGRPRSLAALVLEPPSSLLRQSWAPRRQRYGTVNADGWGVGFYVPGRSEPARWRAARPLGADGTALASEPWDDDPAWVDVPDRHLVDVTPDGVSLTPLEACT